MPTAPTSERSSEARPRVGTAGWSIPSASAGDFPGGGSHLERYAQRFDAVEIDTSFYRPHRRATYERWATAVPAHFRFAVKLPKTITHERRMVDCADLLARFAGEIEGLGEKRGPVLVQLPPSFAFPGEVAGRFFAELAGIVGGPAVCEPRHPSWFAEMADALLRASRVARVAADPAPAPGAGKPGGWRGLAYRRLHGAPQMYRSPYADGDIDRYASEADALRCTGVETWTIFDNTASGAAIRNALEMLNRTLEDDGTRARSG